MRPSCWPSFSKRFVVWAVVGTRASEAFFVRVRPCDSCQSPPPPIIIYLSPLATCARRRRTSARASSAGPRSRASGERLGFGCGREVVFCAPPNAICSHCLSLIVIPSPCLFTHPPARSTWAPEWDSAGSRLRCRVRGTAKKRMNAVTNAPVAKRILSTHTPPTQHTPQHKYTLKTTNNKPKHKQAPTSY
jgi:hypothetical protein